MLYHNDKVINIRKKVALTGVEKAVKDFIDNIIKELGGNPSDKVYPIKLKFHPKFGKRNEYSRMMEFPGARYYSCVRNKTEGTILDGTWLWSEKMPKEDKYKRKTPVPSKVKMDKIMYINKENVELLFWFLWVYKSHYGIDYVLENRYKESRERNNMKRLKTDVEFAIFNNKVLKQFEKRKVASLWGISGSFKNDIEVVMNDLSMVVEMEERKGGNKGIAYTKFLSDIEFDERTELEALIRMVEDEMIISYEKVDNGWRWSSPSGNLGTMIVKVTNFDERYSELVDLLIVNKDIHKLMTTKLKETKKDD
jgi:hypothetical protein